MVNPETVIKTFDQVKNEQKTRTGLSGFSYLKKMKKKNERKHMRQPVVYYRVRQTTGFMEQFSFKINLLIFGWAVWIE